MSKIEQNDGETVSLLTHKIGLLLSGRMSELIAEEMAKRWDEKHYCKRVMRWHLIEL